MNSNEIRSRFVDFYEELGFQLLPRAPMLHPSIPMSFVMSAGLVQVETSLAKTQNRSGNKFTLVQDCFRHFDLEKVGTDNFHLSLFEMPGAFMFSNNGKAETIGNMWKLATDKLGIDGDRVWVSYFKGGRLGQLFLPEDKVTRQIWLDIGFPENRLVGFGIDDNYWIQGDGLETTSELLRKCGASTELFFDRGSGLACRKTCKPGCKCGRFIEFSNSLFISNEFHREENHLSPMSDPFIETVIGTERVSMISQGVDSVFQTEIYRPIIEVIRNFTRCKALPTDTRIVNERVIADYIRALCVLVADGAPPPGKNGRERIIKLLYRGIITRQLILGIQSPTFLPALIESFTRTIPLRASGFEEKLKEYYETESPRFRKTISRGHKQLEMMISRNQGKTLSGLQILSLEKQWGLPYLLTAMTLNKRGMIIESEAYFEECAKWKKSTLL